MALARACFAAADVVLLDDPLSALDAHTGRQIMDQCARCSIPAMSFLCASLQLVESSVLSRYVRLMDDHLHVQVHLRASRQGHAHPGHTSGADRFSCCAPVHCERLEDCLSQHMCAPSFY